MPCYLTTCESVARAAGEVLRQWQGKITVREKAKADLVTEADLASQELIRSLIAAEFPDHQFLGEEGETAVIGETAEFCWVVDPLDGTTNYVHGLPGWCVSVGLVRHGTPIAGCVYDPERNVCYTGRQDRARLRTEIRLKPVTLPSLEIRLSRSAFRPASRKIRPKSRSFYGCFPRFELFDGLDPLHSISATLRVASWTPIGPETSNRGTSRRGS